MDKNGSKRKRKHAGGQGKHHAKSKKRRHVGFWIDECREFKPITGTEKLTVLITQVELTDRHTHVPVEKNKEAPQAAPSKDDEEDKTSKVIETNKATSKETFDCSVPADTTKEIIGDEIQMQPPLSTKTELETVTNADSDVDRPAEIPAPSLLSTKAKVESEETNGDKCMDGPADSVDSPKLQPAIISVQRAASAKQPQTKFPQQDFQVLPHGDCGDGIVNPYSNVDDRYWAQRRRLFSRFDEGIQLDQEGWYSVTPEAIAHHIADRVVRSKEANSSGLVILDAFCGCGGNAIAFALRPEVGLVVCVDTDVDKLRFAAQNASIYNIAPEKLLFHHGNALTVLQSYEQGRRVVETTKDSGSEFHGPYTLNSPLPANLDCIFLSPPWGGPKYLQVKHYHFATGVQLTNEEGATVNGDALLQLAAKAQKNVVCFLPRNQNGISLGRSALVAGYHNETLEMEKNMLNGKFKTVTAYLGLLSSNK